MPRYYFHTVHGRSIRDLDGETLVDARAAHRTAVRVLGEILRDGSPEFLDDEPFSLICLDQQGDVVTGLSARRLSGTAAARVLLDAPEAEEGPADDA